MISRLATHGDLESIRSIADAYGNLANWPGRPDYLDHEFRTGTLMVCEDEGKIVGFGGVLERDGMTHLADLFVRPERLGGGIGKSLLSELFSRDGVRLTFSSKDARALPLYVRFGMLPIAPLLYLTGDSETALRLPDSGVALAEADAASIGELDRNACGRDRHEDLEFLDSLEGSHALLAKVGKEVVGYGYCRLAEFEDISAKHAFLGPVGAPTAAGAVRTSVAILRWAAEYATQATIAVFGPNAATSMLLAAHFRIEDVDTFMASRSGLIDLERYHPSVEFG